MNASRKVLRASSNTVKKIYNYGEKSLQGNFIQGTIIVILIVLTAVVLKFLPLNFLCFFNNIIVKVIFLIVIAFVALYCPAIGLMLAILLVSIIQMCQRKQLSMDIDNIKKPKYDTNMRQPDMNIFESMTGDKEDGASNENEGGASNENEGGASNENGGDDDDDQKQDQDGYIENDGNEDGRIIENWQNKNGNIYPQGFNDDTSCLTGCGGSSSSSGRELDGMCGNVKTWSNQFSAQGLDGDIVGLQPSIGYPI